jgi:hypothetical protein
MTPQSQRPRQTVSRLELVPASSSTIQSPSRRPVRSMNADDVHRLRSFTVSPHYLPLLFRGRPRFAGFDDFAGGVSKAVSFKPSAAVRGSSSFGKPQFRERIKLLPTMHACPVPHHLDPSPGRHPLPLRCSPQPR